MDDRLTELETRITFQDGTIGELNDIITRQQGEIDRLVQALELLKEEIRQLAHGPMVSAADEPPPHY
ncbi:MAG: SlyX family protein [Gammaproteobacteria bacterium]|nr:SlyX family protein [Gammaproteobacteria bacterium]